MDDVEVIWAQNTEAMVKRALKATRGRRRAGLVDDAVASSYTERGSKTGWLEPSPWHVLVFSEGSIGDPMTYPDVWRWFDAAVQKLEAEPFVEEAGWESINPAVQYFWVKPRFIGNEGRHPPRRRGGAMLRRGR